MRTAVCGASSMDNRLYHTLLLYLANRHLTTQAIITAKNTRDGMTGNTNCDPTLRSIASMSSGLMFTTVPSGLNTKIIGSLVCPNRRQTDASLSRPNQRRFASLL